MRIPAKGALVLPGLVFVATAVLGLVSGRPDTAVGILIIGAVVTAATAFSFSRFRVLTGETWIAAEYVLINRLVRLDDLVKASIGIGSYPYLTLRDAQGGSIMIDVSTTLPRVRTQVVKGIVQALQRGMRIDGHTASALGLRIWRPDLKSP